MISTLVDCSDGSVTPGAPFSGYAIVTADDKMISRFRLADFVSSFCVESMAIIEALSARRTIAHRGIRRNERADELAKDAAKCGDVSKIGIPLKELKNMWKLKINVSDWCRAEAQFRSSYYFSNFFSDSGQTCVGLVFKIVLR